jgi:hypothetical protein
LRVLTIESWWWFSAIGLTDYHSASTIRWTIENGLGVGGR